MPIEFNIHKTLEILGKLKIPFLTTVISFISSINLWFLSLYFLDNGFLLKHGVLISLMVTVALSTTWYLFAAITIPKDFLLYCFASDSVELIDGIKDKTGLNLFVFAETIILHSFFIYLAYLFQWRFFSLITIAFLTIGLKYLATDLLLRIAYDKHKKDTN